MDRRTKKTRKAIFDAFADLLSYKTYNNITVQDIIDKADIGRSTFYSHFETKDELLNALCAKIFAHVFKDDLTKERTHDFSGEEKEIRKVVTHILYHIQDNKRYIKPILFRENDEILMRYLKAYLTPVFEGQIEKIDTDVPKNYLLHHILCDFTETVRWWAAHEQYSPEAISDFFFSAIPILHV